MLLLSLAFAGSYDTHLVPEDAEFCPGDTAELEIDAAPTASLEIWGRVGGGVTRLWPQRGKGTVADFERAGSTLRLPPDLGPAAIWVRTDLPPLEGCVDLATLEGDLLEFTAPTRCDPDRAHPGADLRLCSQRGSVDPTWVAGEFEASAAILDDPELVAAVVRLESDPEDTPVPAFVKEGFVYQVDPGPSGRGRLSRQFEPSWRNGGRQWEVLFDTQDYDGWELDEAVCQLKGPKCLLAFDADSGRDVFEFDVSTKAFAKPGYKFGLGFMDLVQWDGDAVLLGDRDRDVVFRLTPKNTDGTVVLRDRPLRFAYGAHAVEDALIGQKSLVIPDSPSRTVEFPSSQARVAGGHLYLFLTEDWVSSDGDAFPEGALVRAELNRWEAGDDTVQVLFIPKKSSLWQFWVAGEQVVLVEETEKGRWMRWGVPGRRFRGKKQRLPSSIYLWEEVSADGNTLYLRGDGPLGRTGLVRVDAESVTGLPEDLPEVAVSQHPTSTGGYVQIGDTDGAPVLMVVDGPSVTLSPSLRSAWLQRGGTVVSTGWSSRDQAIEAMEDVRRDLERRGIVEPGRLVAWSDRGDVFPELFAFRATHYAALGWDHGFGALNMAAGMSYPGSPTLVLSTVGDPTDVGDFMHFIAQRGVETHFIDGNADVSRVIALGWLWAAAVGE